MAGYLDAKFVSAGSDGKLGEEFLAIILRAFEALHPFYAPLMGIDDEDFYQRVEMVCSQCVQVDAPLDWYSYVYKKPASAWYLHTTSYPSFHHHSAV